MMFNVNLQQMRDHKVRHAFYRRLERLGVSMRVERVGDTKFVHVDAPLFVEKHCILPATFSAEFTDWQCLNDRYTVEQLLRYDNPDLDA